MNHSEDSKKLKGFGTHRDLAPIMGKIGGINAQKKRTKEYRSSLAILYWQRKKYFESLKMRGK